LFNKKEVFSYQTMFLVVLKKKNNLLWSLYTVVG